MLDPQDVIILPVGIGQWDALIIEGDHTVVCHVAESVRWCKCGEDNCRHVAAVAAAAFAPA